MRTNAAFLVGVVLTGAAMLVGFWGCGTGPLEQSYAIQSGAESVNSSIAEETELPSLMKQMRAAHLNLVDRLTAGSPEQIVRAGVQVSILARGVAKYQPAIARDSVEEAATFKRLAHEVQDMAVEVAKAADNGRMPAADQYYVRLYLTCNQCHRLFRGFQAPSAPMEIPELETPKPPEEEPESGTTPAPAELLPAPPGP